MQIRKKGSAPVVTLALVGRLDTNTAPQLDAALNTVLEGVRELTLDMQELEYLSSAGLRSLLAAQKRMAKQGSMVLCNVNEAIMEVFELTGFSSILEIR